MLCRKCNKHFSVENFAVTKYKNHIYHYFCKSCKNISQSSYESNYTSNRLHIETISDKYVFQQLKAKNIPAIEPFISIQRNLIKLKRTIKQHEKTQ